jgi:hypothetical protein
VVHDRPDEVAVFIAPGYPAKRRNSERGGLPSHNHRPVTAWLDGWTDRPWRTFRLLTLKRPNDAHSISLSWRDDTLEFNGWYIDLTSPIQRVASGFDVVEHGLDVVVPPDMSSYELKDEDELDWAEAHGTYTRAEAEQIRREAERAVTRLRAERGSFERWRDWRPDSSWAVPVLPAEWDAD